jgi:hypothetical protein
MSTKQKASMRPNGTARGSVGRPPKRYTVDDVVKLVSFSFQTVVLKIAIVVCEITDATSSFADLKNCFLRKIRTNKNSGYTGDRE